MGNRYRDYTGREMSGKAHTALDDSIATAQLAHVLINEKMYAGVPDFSVEGPVESASDVADVGDANENEHPSSSSSALGPPTKKAKTKHDVYQ